MTAANGFLRLFSDVRNFLVHLPLLHISNTMASFYESHFELTDKDSLDSYPDIQNVCLTFTILLKCSFKIQIIMGYLLAVNLLRYFIVGIQRPCTYQFQVCVLASYIIIRKHQQANDCTTNLSGRVIIPEQH